MSLMYDDLLKYMSGELKPLMRQCYTNESMYQDMHHIQNLVYIWCQSFFGDYCNSLSSLFVMHRIVFDIEHMRQFDEVCRKIYDKYALFRGDDANMKYLKDLFLRMVERMASHYRNVEIQTANAVSCIVTECVPCVAVLVEVNKVPSIIEDEFVGSDPSSFDRQVSESLLNQVRIYQGENVNNVGFTTLGKIELYINGGSFLDDTMREISLDFINDGFRDRYYDYYKSLNAIVPLLRLTPRERRFYTIFLRTIYYDVKAHVVFINFGRVTCIALGPESFAGFFKRYLCLFKFNHLVCVGSDFIDFFGEKNNALYSYFSFRYKYDFVPNSYVVNKPFNRLLNFRKLTLDYHLGAKCVKIDLFQLELKSPNYELLVDEFFFCDDKWHLIHENYGDAYRQCDIKFYYLKDGLSIFWPDSGEGFMDGDAFTGLFEFVLSELVKSEYIPQSCFVILSFGNCCPAIDYSDGDSSDYHDPVSCESNSYDDPPYLREYTSGVD